MPIDFPDNPTTGDTFTSNGRTWEWDGSRWNAVVSPLITEDSILTKTVRTVSADTSLVADDVHQVIRFTGTELQTLTVDNVLSPGQSVQVIQDNTGQIEFSSGTGVTLLSDSGEFGSNGQNKRIEIFCAADGEYRLYGDLVAIILPTFDVEYLVVAGGGGGGGFNSGGPGGGGAGGYRSSVNGENSGGGASAESPLALSSSINYTVTVGAGGAGSLDDPKTAGDSGSNSVFATVTSTGGGGGGFLTDPAKTGGSGGGGAGFNGLAGASGTANQGFAGGNGDNGGSGNRGGGGGGGASSVGQNGSGDLGGNGGNGVTSSITGSAVTRGGGGGAGSLSTGPSSGGSGGGGDGGRRDEGSFEPNQGKPGTANTGGGGGGSGFSDAFTEAGGNGGSGVVILRYPSDYTITLGAGLTGSTSTVGANKVTEITAGTGNVSFA